VEGWLDLDTAVSVQPMPKAAYRSNFREKHRNFCLQRDPILGPLNVQKQFRGGLVMGGFTRFEATGTQGQRQWMTELSRTKRRTEESGQKLITSVVCSTQKHMVTNEFYTHLQTRLALFNKTQCQPSNRILQVGIKYSWHDVTCYIANYCNTAVNDWHYVSWGDLTQTRLARTECWHCEENCWIPIDFPAEHRTVLRLEVRLELPAPVAAGTDPGESLSSSFQQKSQMCQINGIKIIIHENWLD